MPSPFCAGENHPPPPRRLRDLREGFRARHRKLLPRVHGEIQGVHVLPSDSCWGPHSHLIEPSIDLSGE